MLKDNIKVGDYVRTKRGRIHKITDLSGYYENGRLIKEKQLVHIDNKISGWNCEQFNEIIIKSSPNIIDLIKEGDYVNGHLVIKRHNDLMLEDTFDLVQDEDIKSIVTKECFKSMEYKIEK